MEENPLQTSKQSQIKQNISINKSGRPNSNTVVNFGPQPKSMVVQMLSKLKTTSTSKFINGSNETLSYDYNYQPDKTDIKDTQVSCENSDKVNQSLHEDLHSGAEITNVQDNCKTTLKEFTCDYPSCSYTCKLSSNLIKHKRIHTNEKPYLCDQCSFRSNFINSLKAHKRTHTADRPFQCEYCSYKCNTSSNLKKHCRHRHLDQVKGHVT